jgi:glycerol-3-phosphate dehydrogenase (NAD(P)+)
VEARVSRIAIIGAGAWGTGLAVILARKGTHDVRLWAYEPEVREAITVHHVNAQFLPGQRIPESVIAANDLQEALRDAEIVVSVMPSQHCRKLMLAARPFLNAQMLIVSATKGLEEKSLSRMTEVITEVVASGSGFEARVGALSGPSFAVEAARGDPTALTIASRDAKLAETIQREFSDP